VRQQLPAVLFSSLMLLLQSNGDILLRQRQQDKMSEAWEMISGDAASAMLIIADHASNHVPADIDLQIAPELLGTHIAIDLGVAELAKALGLPAILGGVSNCE
jgi:predicted N-formylglutamate amidohydrolase